MKKFMFLLAGGLLLMTSCKKDEGEDPINNDQSNLELIHKDTTDNDYIIELYATKDVLEVGYQPLYVKVKNLDGNSVKDAEVLFYPEMDMVDKQHSAPIIQPTYSSKTNSYEGVVIFTMPTGNMGTWTLEVDVNGGKAEFPVVINTSKTDTKYIGTYMGSDEKRYVVSLVKPFDWKVGLNEFSLMVHQNNMFDFPIVEGLTIELDPQMTSMGHGSPNNVNPTDKGNGYYTGTVNYTMTGDWRLNLEISKDGEVLIENAYFDILF